MKSYWDSNKNIVLKTIYYYGVFGGISNAIKLLCMKYSDNNRVK